MQNFYYYRWLKGNGVGDPEVLDCLKFALDKRVYYYGEQFASPAERSPASALFSSAKELVREAVGRLRRVPETSGTGPAVSSNAYFSFNAALASCGFRVLTAPWHALPAELHDDELYARVRRARLVLENADFRELLSDGFARDFHALKAALKEYYLRSGSAALVVPFDLPFFERLAIKIFRELDRPSFISLHGLPGRYNLIDDNRTDHLLVWGEKIRRNYIAAGIDAEKIHVTGHPECRTLPLSPPKFSLENVLVISKSMGGAQHCSEEILTDRGNLALYLFQVRKALEKAGVRRVRLRLHPSESWSWYDRFIDGDFFRSDTGTLAESLSAASLVVGPTSTVFLESLLAGVNYLIYDPAVAGRDLVNFPLVPPFDGSEPGIPAAHSEDELDALLASRRAVDISALSGYLKVPFDLSFMRKLVGEQGPRSGPLRKKT